MSCDQVDECVRLHSPGQDASQQGVEVIVSKDDLSIETSSLSKAESTSEASVGAQAITPHNRLQGLSDIQLQDNDLEIAPSMA